MSSNRHNWAGKTRRWVIVGGLVGSTFGLTSVVASETAASAGVPGGLACAVTSSLGLSPPGWDQDATTAPTTLAQAQQAIGATKLYHQGINGAGVGVALVDSGIVPVTGLNQSGQIVNGPDLSFDSQAGGPAYLDDYGHGTHMAGIIAGNDGVAGGFQGIAPGAHIVNLKVAAHDGAADVSQILAAIDWTVQHRNDPGLNIRVLNLSYGTTGVQSYQLDPIAFAVENAWNHGIVTVVAGGNNGTSSSTLTDPAIDPYVLAVGAADVSGGALPGCGSVASFSSRSATRPVDVVAPGVSIASLRDPGSFIDVNNPGAVVASRYLRGSGTSEAAAMTSGAVALLLQARPNLTPDQVKSLLTASAKPLALMDSTAEGAGMIDVAAASHTPLVFTSAQSWPAATGTGSLEASRGGSHVAMNGAELTGEQDIMGIPWNGAVWAPASAAAAAWNGGVWNSEVWAGSSWTGTSWAGLSWGTASWTGGWTGGSWNGGSWNGGSWNGGSWNGGSWNGGSWNGGSWNGGSWNGGSWNGGSWNGGSWNGGSWNGGSWNGGSWNGGSWNGGSWNGGAWN